MSITALFVGGPLDGEEHQMREAPYVYSVPVFPEPLCIITDGPCEEAVSFERVDYRRAGRWSVAPGHMVYTAPGIDVDAFSIRRWLAERDRRRVQTALVGQFDDLVQGWNEVFRRWDEIARHCGGEEHDRQDSIVHRYRPNYLPDAHTVRFSEMSAEAEAELAAWDEMLHGRNRT